MHEHILRNRITDYPEGGLHHHLHGAREHAPLDRPPLPAEKRLAFEHFHPGRKVLAAFPVREWPYFQAEMARRARSPGNWMGKLSPSENRLAKHILAEITARGPLGSEHIADQSRAFNGWNHSRLAKVVMDKLLGHGRLLISRRRHGRRIYDLPERVIPAAILAQPRPSSRSVARWTARQKLRQHRLASLSRPEVQLLGDEVQSLTIDENREIHCLRTDLPLLEAVRSGQIKPPSDLRLLAPLDPLIIDRSLVKRLWDFDYTWEVYTPAAKRRRGYYALPLLAGDQLVGHADLKVDRTLGKLHVLNRHCPRPHRLAPAVKALETFLRSS